MIVRCLLSISLIAFVFGKPTKIDSNFFMKHEDDIKTCGYDSCHPIKPGMLNVHLVPHTHDDVGWLKTVDQYFYGSKSNIQKAGVQYILDSVIQELMRDPNKRFIYVETAYLWKWWKKQHDTLRHQVKKLINRGQLEIIGGGWVMNDEAVTHYQSIIDQFTWGLRKLNETFGDCGRPRVGWQIDPFGHSREMASLFAQMGYDGLLFGRLDYQDKRQRLKTKTAEMVWQGSANLGNTSQLFTSVLYNNYQPPPGFCFDVLCDDDPIIDDKRSPEYNVDRKVAAISYFAKEQAKYYSTNNVIFTMGGDFTYMDAHMWFKNLDKLISSTNALQANKSNVNLLYSTPSCYLKAVNEENENRKWPVKSDDFFPYASDPNSFWTGYFTSRPTLKRFERMGNNFLQVCKQLYSITDLGPEDWVDLNVLREAMGVMQHHDAITGTEKEHVAHDYARLLSQGFDECEIITNTALNKLMVKKYDDDTVSAPKLPLQSCLLLNISQCDISEKSNFFVVTLYNPLSRPISRYVRLPVTGKSYTVTDPNGEDLIVQLTPIPENVLRIPGRVSDATAELMFHASEIPPLGFKSYYVKHGATNEDSTLQEDISDKFNLNVGHIALKMKKNGLLSNIKMKDSDISLSQDFYWYRGAVGNNREAMNRSSGAYIFRPNGTTTYRVSEDLKTKTYKGPLTQEIHQTYNEWVSQIIRIYEQELYIEYEWLVGPIPVHDHLGKEIISKFSTNLKTDNTFYTDSNGREMLKRIRNYRPTWKIDLNESIAGNYYPVTSKIVVRDEKQNLQFAVLTDRAQGGSSLEDGQIELMVHRRLLNDDAFGVDEALNEKAFGQGLVARGQHYVLGGPYINASHDNIVIQEKDLAQRKLLDAWTFITPINDMSYQKYKNQYVMQYSGLKAALPKNIQILTLEPWKAYTFLLRLEHVFEKTDDPIMSQPVTVDIKNIFVPFTLKSAKETTLGGNQWLEEKERLQWKLGENLENYVNQPDYFDITETDFNNNNDTNEIMSDEPYDSDVDNRIIKELDRLNPFMFTFNPMQIRTFVIEIDKV